MALQNEITITEMPSTTGDAQGLAATANLRLLGFSCKEDSSTPAAAEFILRHGSTTADTAIAYVKLAASASLTEVWMFPGIPASSGVFIDRVSGQTKISILTNTIG